MKSFARKLYHKVKILHNEHYRFNHLKLGLKCKSRWYGNHYGGFYLNPSLINEESIIYSFGIGEDISFDLQLIDNHKCHVYGFDPTPKSIKWCQKQMLPENFHFYDYGISEKTGKVDFHLPKNKEHVSGSLLHQENVSVSDKVTVEVKSINDIFKILKHEKIDVLKMDIEGSEYQVIESILNSNIKIIQLAIEIHERFFENGKEKSIQLIEKLKKHGYQIFAVSSSYEEISFVKQSYLIN